LFGREVRPDAPYEAKKKGGSSGVRGKATRKKAKGRREISQDVKMLSDVRKRG